MEGRPPPAPAATPPDPSAGAGNPPPTAGARAGADAPAGGASGRTEPAARQARPRRQNGLRANAPRTGVLLLLVDLVTPPAADPGGTGPADTVVPGPPGPAGGAGTPRPRETPTFRGTGPLPAALLLLVGLVTFASGAGRPGPALQWAAVAILLALPLWWARRSVRSRAAPPTWSLGAFLAASAGLLVLHPQTGASVVLILMGTAFGIQRLEDRPAAVLGAVSLLVVLAASLRERLAFGSNNGIVTALVAYAVAFGALIAARQRHRRVAETERLLRELAAEHARLEEAHAALAQHARNVAALAASEERNRIARDIHDVLAHALTAMIVQAEAAAVRLRTDPGAAGDQVRAVANLARQALQEARLSVAAIRADPGAAGLDALRRLCDDAERWSGMGCFFAVDGAERPLPAPAALAAYRILQEALTNARRHGRAERVDITAAFRPDGLLLTVADDGGAGAPAAGPGEGTGSRQSAADGEARARAAHAAGAGRGEDVHDGSGQGHTGKRDATAAAPPSEGGAAADPARDGVVPEAGAGAGPREGEPLPGSGLRGMRERAEALGGTLQAGPVPGGRGFVVRAFLPLPQEPARTGPPTEGPPAPEAAGRAGEAVSAVRPAGPRDAEARPPEAAPQPAPRGGAP